MTDPWARPANQVPPGPTAATVPAGPAPGQPRPASAAWLNPRRRTPSLPVKIKNLFRDPLSIVLVAVIVMALVGRGSAGGRAVRAQPRRRAWWPGPPSAWCRTTHGVVRRAAAVPDAAHDRALQQHPIETAGNQIREAKGMKVDDQHRRRPARGHRELQRLDRLVGRERSPGRRRHQADHPERDPPDRQLRHRRDDQPVRRHDRAARARWAASPPSPRSSTTASRCR